jgi:hypothetical protein
MLALPLAVAEVSGEPVAGRLLPERPRQIRFPDPGRPNQKNMLVARTQSES